LKLVEVEVKGKLGSIMGIDVHKDVLIYCILIKTKYFEEFQVSNNKGIYVLISTIKRLHVSGVVVESTAQYYFKLIFALIDLDILVLVANPHQIKSRQGK